MAKKRKEKPEEEELDFKLPKFDEEKFLKKERRNIKTLFISFLFGLLIALISFGFWTLLSDSGFRWELVLLLGVFNISWLKYLFLKLNIDLTDFGRKGWFGSFALYFFTWIIVLIVLVNPPFYDEESPNIEVVTLPGMQELGGTVEIAALITDNVGVEKQRINFTLIDPNNNTSSPDFAFENNIFEYTYENIDNLIGEYAFTISATDINGKTTEIEGAFEYSNNTLRITSSRFTDIRSGDSILIKTDERTSGNDFRVYYRIGEGEEINVSRKEANDKEEYETTAKYEGWDENTNHTMKVYVEVSHYFVNIGEKFNNTIEDTTAYNFSTGDDSDIGTDVPLTGSDLNYNLPRPIGIAATPGFELALFIISLIIVALIFKNRKKDKEI